MVAMARVMEVVASNTSKRKGNVELKPIVLDMMVANRTDQC